MTNKDDTHSWPKSKHTELRAELSQLHDQLQHIFAVNQFQRQLLFGWLHEQGTEDIYLLGFSLTDQWQSHTEQRLSKTLGELRDKLT